jgi:DNA polymerase I
VCTSRSRPAGPRPTSAAWSARSPLLAGDLVAVQDAYLATAAALRRRAIPTRDVTARVRLTKRPDQYLATRDSRRELPYEAVLASGRTTWTAGERIRIYRGTRGRACLWIEPDDADDAGDPGAAPDDAGDAIDPVDLAEPTAVATAAAPPGEPRDGDDLRDPRDYDVEHYLRVLRDTYAARLARALTPEDFAAIFADPEQPSLFARPLGDARPILTPIPQSEPGPEPDEPMHRTLHS